jgi:uncharacterized membrane protein YphA (DoxX/SURF4 family)
MIRILSHRSLNLVLRFVVGGVFAYAAFEKVTHPASFAIAVRGYKIIPFSLSNFFAIAVSWSELLAAAMLILGILTRKAAATAFLLLIVFMAAIGAVMVRGMVVDCGCFGEGGAHTSWLLLVRNALLLFGAFLIIRYNDGWLSLFPGARPATRPSPTS